MVKKHLYSEDETRCRRYMGYSFLLAARILLYAPPHRQDSTCHGLYSPFMEHWLEREIAQWSHREGSYHGATSCSPKGGCKIV